MATKPENGKFSPSYFLLGEGKKDWLRTLGDDARRLIIYGIIFCILFFLYTTFWPKKPQGNISKPDSDCVVVVTPGAKVTGNITQSTSTTTTQKVEEKKNKWWIPHLYSGVAVGGRIKSSGNNLDFGSAEPEVRADFLGLRWDWN